MQYIHIIGTSRERVAPLFSFANFGTRGLICLITSKRLNLES